MQSTTVILLGTNLGDKILMLHQAKLSIQNNVGAIVRTSSLYETAAWGITNQPSFCNCILEVITHLTPDELLNSLLTIEAELGRIRDGKWAPRTIDLDILYYNDQIISSDNLVIPHPQIQNRRFTLVPLCEILPDFIHPILNLRNSEILSACKDGSEVVKLSSY
jgi:2-amino-4-hydroxy-6-hydroxymethyldihydropteridine diphosphokinase